MIRNLSQRGFSSVAAVVVAAAIFIMVGFLFDFIRRDVHLGDILETQEKIVSWGLDGAAETIGYLTSNSDFAGGAYGTPDAQGYYEICERHVMDLHGKQVGHFRSKAKNIHLDYMKQDFQHPFLVYTEAFPWPAGGTAKEDMKETIFTFLCFDDIGQYFMAIQNSDLIVRAGADFRYGSIYGYNVRFMDVSDTIRISPEHPIRVKRVEYVGAFYPSGDSEGFGKFNDQEIIINPYYPDPWSSAEGLHLPVQIPREHRFPTLTPQDFQYYMTEANKYPANGVLDTPAETNQITGDIYPPHCPAGACGNPVSFIYYSESDLKIGGVTVHGQVVFVTQGKILINGDIKKHSEYTIDDYGNDLGALTVGGKGSRCHQITLMARGGVSILRNFPGNTAFNLDEATNTHKLTIQAYIVTPDGTVSVDSVDADDPANYPATALSLVVYGGMVLNRTPDLSDFFQNSSDGSSREYLQDPKLWSYPPPLRKYMRIFAQVHYGGAYKLVFSSTPQPTSAPTWMYSPIPDPSGT